MSLQVSGEGQPLEERLRTLEWMLSALLQGLTEPLHAAPSRVREGQFAFADGTNWNPGAGRGLYQYVSGAWTKL